MNKFHICYYGCGKEARYQLLNGNWCCEKSCNSCPSKKIKIKKIIQRENPGLCEYGCGKPATYSFKNGKWCCSSYFKQCSSYKKIINKKEKPKECDYGCGNPALYYFKTANKWCCNLKTAFCKGIKTKTSNSVKKTLIEFKQKYPQLFEEEDLIEENGIIKGKCRFCQKWFSLKYEQLRSRANAIKNKIRNSNCYFFCSESCKIESPDFLKGNRCDPVEIINFRTYRVEVDRLTEITIKKNKIEGIEFRGKKFRKSLDHKFSARAGFDNNIDPKLIANINNLKIIDSNMNSKKKTKCSITIDELLSNYCK